MKFSIQTGNHDNSLTIADTVWFLRQALRDCGHEVQINASVRTDRVNILIEHFIDDAAIDLMRRGRDLGARYIVVATEPISHGRFHGGVLRQHWHYGDGDRWTRRFDGFMRVASFCDAIWVLDQSMLDSYRQVLPDANVLYLPHAHVTGFGLVQHLPEAQKDIDFYFSGTITSYRESLLKELQRRGHTVLAHEQGAAPYLRDEWQSRAKVCLSLRLDEANLIPSVSRMHYHLHQANYLIHERYELPCALDPYVLHVPPNELVDWAEAALEVPDRREAAQGMLQRFRDGLSMRALLPPLMKASLEGTASVSPMLAAA
jgi:hypothetical protein